ncbi:MAG: ABC transporter substrate-binding protein [Acetobacteraceae bacterium]
MKSSILKALAVASLLAASLTGPARAEDGIYVPLFTYRTGPFSGSGQHVANGMHDYLAMLNERDGGIGGVKLLIEECETGYDTKKGLECYEAVKGKNPVMVNPWSTGITLPLIPRAAVDRIPILSTAYGLSASGRGDLFPWVFNPPDTYWDGLSMILSFINTKEGGAEGGGFEKLKGKKLGYLYLDAGFGKEPIPLFEQLAKSVGFELKFYPVAAADMQNQSSQWLGIRRDKPDYVVLYGWGALNPTAIKEAVRANYPMEKLLSIWWPAEEDARNAGPGAAGVTTLNWHGSGNEYPALQDILRLVYGKGGSQGSKEHVGDVLYNRGIYNSVLIAEAIRNAQTLSGKKLVDGADVRRGLEALNLTEARWAEIGLPGFAGPIQLSCQDHNGHRPAFMQRWDGAKWVKASGLIQPATEQLSKLLDEAADDYVAKASGWPKRAEACDRS